MKGPRIYDVVQIEYDTVSDRNIPMHYFITPYKNKYILYFPLKGVVALVNDGFASKIGTDDILVKEMFEFAEKQLTVEPHFKNEIKKEMVIELTTACNLKCIYCYANGGDNPKYIDLKSIKAAIDYKLSNCNSKILGIQFAGGGEPLLAFPMMKRCYEYAKKEGDKKNIIIDISLITNGTLITEDMAKWFKKIGMKVTISFDGLPEVQNRQRPFRDGSQTNNAVENTIKIFNKHKVKYQTQSIITEYSINKITDIIENLHKLGVKNCLFGDLMILGRCSKNHLNPAPKEKYRIGLKKVKRLAKIYDINYNDSGEKESSPPVTVCVGCGYLFVLTANKNITSCTNITDPSDPVHKTFCYGKIENGKVRINNRKLEYLQNLLPVKMKKCDQCFAKYFCFGECPADTVRNGKSSFNRTEQECNVIKAKAMKNLINILKIF